MKTIQISFEESNTELLNYEELLGIDGGRTSFAYDAGTFLRVMYQSAGRDYGGAISTLGSWLGHQ